MFAERYIGKVVESLRALSNQEEAVRKAASAISNCVLGGGGVFVFDSHGIIENELVNRASGLALFRSLSHGGVEPAEGDILLIASILPGNENDLARLDDARALGITVITISPPGKLADNADIAIINSTDARNGVIEVPGIGRPFCPVSGITNAALAWMLASEIVASMMAQGKTPTVFWGEYLDGGKGKKAEALKRFASHGY